MSAHNLHVYSRLIVRIALNLQPGQRLLIIGPLASGGLSLDAAPLARAVAAAAYDAGSPFVEAIWGDEALQLARLHHAPRDSFDEVSAWFPGTLVQHVEGGHAVLSVSANDPDLLSAESPEAVKAIQKATSREFLRFRELIGRNETNWAVVAAPASGWARRVFPELSPDEQTERLWDAVVRACRLDQDDPLDAWERHLSRLADRTAQLNGRQYTALRYRAEGTDLTVGLPVGHVWVSGRTPSRSGVEFTANLPTEEVFTMAHKDRADGIVRSTKPLSHGGRLVKNFTLTFAEGRVTHVTAADGEDVLRSLIETDEGARRLGEVALVPNSSPISQSGLLFYNTLFDENAASHLAIGAAYRFTLSGGSAMDDEAFARAGGNQSSLHQDFMIGSAELNVDGVCPDGTLEAVMRHGEWAL